jgi:NTE family protein
VDRATARERVGILSRIPLFSSLSDDELTKLAELFTKASYAKGEIVCSQNDESATFYVVATGELEVWGGGDGTTLLARLLPGEYFGEMALLMGGKRSATVTVSRRAHLLALERGDFERLFLQNPKVLEHLSRVLAQRLAVASRGERPERATTTIGVTAEAGLKGKSIVATALSHIIQKVSERPVLLVRAVGSDEAPRKRRVPLLSKVKSESADAIRKLTRRRSKGVAVLEVALDPEGSEQLESEALSAIIVRMSHWFPFMILDLGVDHQAAAGACRGVSDFLVEVVQDASGPKRENGREPRALQVLNLYNRGTQRVPINHCEPFVIPRDGDIENTDPHSAAKHLISVARSPASPPLHRLARKILGTTVGIAVGGGAAFGIAHVGVLQVLEEHGIPVDLVAGTSMGSIVGVGYAMGITPTDMREIARRVGTKRTTISALDFTLFKPGILAGNRLVEIFRPFFSGLENFEQLTFPFRAVATDIESGERVSIGSGRLDTAFRASCSVPMLWAPVKHMDRVLVDGGIVDPVPADVVREMGAEVCIAVNVVPPLKKGVSTALSRTYRAFNHFNPLAYMSASRDLPNMFDIVMNSMQMLEHELGNFNAISADVRIVPNLSDFTWIEFYRPEEMIERGAEAAELAVPLIKKILAERVASAGVHPGQNGEAARELDGGES